jgi:PAS domain S-box-containing protein
LKKKLRLLILEDNDADAELIIHTLRRNDFEPEWRQVETEEDFLECLDPSLDIILADYTLPQFDAWRALEILKGKKLDIPVIIVTGTISEETAVECIRIGASDYLLKDRMTRLGPAVTHALEEKRLRAEKKASREKIDYQARLLSHVHDAVIATDPRFNLTFWNRSAEKIYGFKPDEVLGHSAGEILKAPDFGIKRDEDVRQFNENGYFSGEVVHHRRNGEPVPIETTIMSFKDERGRIAGHVCVNRDISERLKAEKALRESQSIQKAILDNIPDMAWLKDLEGRFLAVNRAFGDTYGLRPEEIVGKTDRDIWPSELAGKYRKEDQEVINKGRRLKVEESLVSSSTGKMILIETIKTPLFNESGRITGTAGIARDITERKRMELALRESEATCRELLETLEGGILSFDTEGRILFVNARLTWMLGYEPGELSGKKIQDFLTGKEQENFLILLGGLRERRRYKIPGELPRKDGSRIRVIMEISPGSDETGNLTGGIAAISECSDDSSGTGTGGHLKQGLDKSELKVLFLEEELDSLLSSLSRNIQSPLRAIEGFSRFLLEEETLSPDDSLRYLALIRENIGMLFRQEEELAAFIRVNRRPLNICGISPLESLNLALDDLKSERDERRIEISIGKLPECDADPDQLREIWKRLLSNAIKFTSGRETAVVEIGCLRQNGEDVFHVRDNGAGFEMQYAHRLFGLFERMHGKDDFPGTGVGLAIVRRIIHRHGGRVWAESEKNIGTTMYFTLT